MASPLMERIEPHKKAHFSLHLGQGIASRDDSAAAYRSVRYNHKPGPTSDARTTTLSPLSANTYRLTLADTDRTGGQDTTFTLTGRASAPTTSYVLVLDAATQQATLEPLAASFAFNLTTQNGRDVSAQHPPIHPPRHQQAAGEACDDDGAGDPDPANPYDFRHFLARHAEKRGDESEYRVASSPEHSTSKPAKRQAVTANPLVSKPKKTPPRPAAARPPRAATDLPKAKAKAKTKTAAPPASKMLSAEVIHSSDESDDDTQPNHVSPPPTHVRPSPSRAHQQQRDDNSNDDAQGESDDHGGLEIEVPDAHPPRRGNGALKTRGIGPSLGVGAFARSPSNGPISLLSAASSAHASPNPQSLTSRTNHHAQDEIDFGNLDDAEGEAENEPEEEEEEEGEGEGEGEGEDEEQEGNDYGSIEPMDSGPPARQGTITGHERKSSGLGGAVDDDEDDLEKMMMEGLAGGDSSEESEEE